MKHWLWFFIVTLPFGGSVGLALDQADHVETPPGDIKVEVDRVEVHGSSDTAVDLIESYLDLPLSTPLSQSVLQDHLAKLKLRLEALAYFKTIDVRLEKGNIRNHYIVVVSLEALRSFYIGFDGSAHDGKKEIGDYYTKEKGISEQIYAGSRNIAGTGIMADVQIEHIDAWNKQRLGIDSKSEVNVLQSSLFHPAIYGSPYSAGLLLYAGRAQAIVDLPFTIRDGITEPIPEPKQVKSKLDFRYLYGNVGRRFGLMTLNLVGGLYYARNDGDFESEVKEYSYGLGAGYVEKSYLAVVEPGAVANVIIINENIINGKQLRFDGEYTQFVASHQALTTKIYSQLSKSSGDDLLQIYECSVLYQWISPWDWVFGLEPMALVGSERQPGYGSTLSAKYASSTFLTNFAITVGDLSALQSQSSYARRGLR